MYSNKGVGKQVTDRSLVTGKGNGRMEEKKREEKNARETCQSVGILELRSEGNRRDYINCPISGIHEIG